MKIGLKRFIKYYFLYFLTFVGLLFNKIEESYIFILVLPLVFILISQFAGFLLNHFLDKEFLKTKILNKSYLFLFSVIFLVCFYFKFSIWYENEFRKNINANLNFKENHLKNNYEYAAFESLNNLIKDENSYKINAVFFQVYDTIISGNGMKYNFIEFHYYNENTESNNKAKFVNINDVPLNIYFNKNMSYKDEQRIDSLINVTSSYLKEIKKILPDSIKEDLPDSIYY